MPGRSWPAEAFKRAVTRAKERTGKPVYVAEFAYAAAPASHEGQDWANPDAGYPISPEWPATMLRDIAEWGVRNQTLSGIRPYGPDLVRGGWSGMALFELVDETSAVARPALTAIQEGIRRA